MIVLAIILLAIIALAMIAFETIAFTMIVRWSGIMDRLRWFGIVDRSRQQLVYYCCLKRGILLLVEYIWYFEQITLLLYFGYIVLAALENLFVILDRSRWFGINMYEYATIEQSLKAIRLLYPALQRLVDILR